MASKCDLVVKLYKVVLPKYHKRLCTIFHQVKNKKLKKKKKKETGFNAAKINHLILTVIKQWNKLP